MPQLQLPIFPDGVTYITNHLAFRRQDGEVTYFNGHMPVFSHAETDVATFRMITSQFCVTGCQAERHHPRLWGDVDQCQAVGEDLPREGPEGILRSARDARSSGAGGGCGE